MLYEFYLFIFEHGQQEQYFDISFFLPRLKNSLLMSKQVY